MMLLLLMFMLLLLLLFFLFLQVFSFLRSCMFCCGSGGSDIQAANLLRSFAMRLAFTSSRTATALWAFSVAFAICLMERRCGLTSCSGNSFRVWSQETFCFWRPLRKGFGLWYRSFRDHFKLLFLDSWKIFWWVFLNYFGWVDILKSHQKRPLTPWILLKTFVGFQLVCWVKGPPDKAASFVDTTSSEGSALRRTENCHHRSHHLAEGEDGAWRRGLGSIRYALVIGSPKGQIGVWCCFGAHNKR